MPVSSEKQIPWPAQSASGVGSMPGPNPDEAAAVILGELPTLPFLPELPARGPGADLVGRTSALLVDLPVETTAAGWRLAERRGRDLRRAVGMLEADLDAIEAAAAGYRGAFKIQLCGPWTLAASLELTRSIEPALADAGAVADLTASLAEGVTAHVADVRRRLPGTALLVQFDEPALPGVLAGSVPTASGRPGGGAAGAPGDAARSTAEAIIALWRRIGLPLAALPQQVVVTPACGLAGASPARARDVLAQCQAAARLIPELIEEGAR